MSEQTDQTPEQPFTERPPTTEWVILVSRSTQFKGRRFLSKVEQQDGQTHLETPKIVTTKSADGALILTKEDLKPWQSYIKRVLKAGFSLDFHIVPREDAEIIQMQEMIGAKSDAS